MKVGLVGYIIVSGQASGLSAGLGGNKTLPPSRIPPTGY